MFPWRHAAQDELEALLVDHVAARDFPCVGAKAALARGTLDVLACNRLDSAWDDLRIHDALVRFAAGYREEPALFRSFAVVFDGPDDLDEPAFERAIWTRIQSLSDKDVWRGQHYDSRVSTDPEDPHFSLSFGGEAFFVVGLHPHASRPARRFARPTMVFNLHDQFEMLRADGRYEPMREKIMLRDEAIAGTRNPMLARHGEASEARQYSGRVVDEAWRCPFQYGGRQGVNEIPPRSGTAFRLNAGQTLTVIDPLGCQVADLLAYNIEDVREVISSGRTLDYAETIRLTTGHRLYSNRSQPMLEIVADTVGRHDFLLTPCSYATFHHFYPDEPPHRGCFGNLAEALAPYGVTEDMIPVAFNCFMNVPVDGTTGKLQVLPPTSVAGDHIALRATMDLVIGLTACSAAASNGGSFKPIHYRID